MKLVLLASMLALAPIASRCVAASAVKVVDGDTIDVGSVRYRLHGIDAPEQAQKCKSASGPDWKCGQAATKKIEKLIAGKTVVCDNRGEDDVHRVIGVCKADGQDINAAMINSGLAWAFVKYSLDYVPQEASAKAKKIGIWQAETETAWDFRAHKWDVEKQTSPAGCPIKGNINRKNEHIYHTPWSRDYAKTKIDIRKGERWFCDEREALDAGWRAPMWGSK